MNATAITITKRVVNNLPLLFGEFFFNGNKYGRFIPADLCEKGWREVLLDTLLNDLKELRANQS